MYTKALPFMQESSLPMTLYWQMVSQIRTERLDEGEIKVSTWQKEYEAPYKYLFNWLLERKQPRNSHNPHESTIQLEDLVAFLQQIPPNTRKRKRYYVAIRLLWETANLSTIGFDRHGRNINLKRYHGNYSLQVINPRTLPSDEAIVQFAYYVKDKKPQWYPTYCYLAIYGIRNTELLDIHYDYYPNLFVTASKTRQQRYVLPFHEQWVDLFQLEAKVQLPQINRKDSHGFSHAVTTMFRKLEIPFRPKDLRHCYARRTAELNYPTIYAARLMGHSVKVHESAYLNFVGLESYLQARHG